MPPHRICCREGALVAGDCATPRHVSNITASRRRIIAKSRRLPRNGGQRLRQPPKPRSGFSLKWRSCDRSSSCPAWMFAAFARLTRRLRSNRSARAASRPHAVAALIARALTLSREVLAARSSCNASCVRQRTDETAMIYPCERGQQPTAVENAIACLEWISDISALNQRIAQHPGARLSNRFAMIISGIYHIFLNYGRNIHVGLLIPLDHH